MLPARHPADKLKYSDKYLRVLALFATNLVLGRKYAKTGKLIKRLIINNLNSKGQKQVPEKTPAGGLKHGF
jgi:hypothetical protein